MFFGVQERARIGHVLCGISSIYGEFELLYLESY
jgi:hypothetical protein